jgi:hypothetical protein
MVAQTFNNPAKKILHKGKKALMSRDWVSKDKISVNTHTQQAKVRYARS